MGMTTAMTTATKITAHRVFTIHGDVPTAHALVGLAAVTVSTIAVTAATKSIARAIRR